MGRTIGIDTPLLLLVARPLYTRTAILEGCGRPEVLMDGISVLPWTIIVAICTTFRKHVLTIFLAQRRSFHSIANHLKCHPTNIYGLSPTNYLIWPRRQLLRPKEHLLHLLQSHVHALLHPPPVIPAEKRVDKPIDAHKAQQRIINDALIITTLSIRKLWE